MLLASFWSILNSASEGDTRERILLILLGSVALLAV